MSRIAIFPGSFDPITKGHESLVLRSISLFDNIIVALGVNAEKKYMFPMEQREKWLRKVFENQSKLTIVSYQGLTTDLCKQYNASYILRGLRTSADFEFERSIGQMNKKLFEDIETIFMLALPEYDTLSSSIIRDIYRNGGDITAFVPDVIKNDFVK